MTESDDDLRWEPVAKAADIAEGESHVVAIGARRIALYHHAGTFYALKDMCPHAGLPISDGPISDGTVTCPYHGWTFDLATGNGPAGTQVATYPVRENAAGMLEVGV